MKPRRFDTTVSLSISDGDETEIVMVIYFQFKPGEPETGRGYLADPANYDPGSADELDIEEIRLFKSGTQELAVPKWFDTMVRADESLRNSMISEAKEAMVAA